MLMKYNPHIKRAVDIILSVSALVLFSPLILVTAVLIKTESPGPAFFVQTRVGKGFTPFPFIKFRTMHAPKNPDQSGFDPGNASRITRIGKILRKYKIDELPELIHIIKGEMSIVGPRPEIPKYVDMYSQDYTTILEVAPGLSDYASIKYRNEEELLNQARDPKQYYQQFVLPDKLALAKQYVKDISFATDCHIICQTLRALFIHQTRDQDSNIFHL